MITIIAAIGKNRELGKDNKLIWHLKEDMQFFKDNTIGKKIIIGRKTLESLPHLLPGREHLVLTRNNLNIDGVKVFHSKEEILEYLEDIDEEVMVIGGSSIYKEFIDLADKMLITLIDKEYNDADTYFPIIDNNEWNKEILNNINENDINYEHVLYTRKLHK
jgi:dihydrofolate reductase